jgi:ribosomal protein L32E
MVLETAKQRYKNQTGFEFKRLHWWEAVRHQPKWRANSAGPSTTDSFLSLSEAATEEVTHHIGRDRAETVT